MATTPRTAGAAVAHPCRMAAGCGEAATAGLAMQARQMWCRQVRVQQHEPPCHSLVLAHVFVCVHACLCVRMSSMCAHVCVCVLAYMQGGKG